MDILNLEILKTEIPALTESIANYLLEGAVYCLFKHGHTSGCNLEVIGDFKDAISLKWDLQLSDKVEKAWSDTEEAIEYGAVALSISLILHYTKLTIVQRSRKGTGIDYWLGTISPDGVPIIKAGLEVSGIWKETKTNRTKYRINIKKQQVKRSTKNYPVYISVIEFSNPKAHFIKHQE